MCDINCSGGCINCEPENDNDPLIHFYMDEGGLLGNPTFIKSSWLLAKNTKNEFALENFYQGLIKKSFIDLYLERLHKLFPNVKIIERKNNGSTT